MVQKHNAWSKKGERFVQQFNCNLFSVLQRAKHLGSFAPDLVKLQPTVQNTDLLHIAQNISPCRDAVETLRSNAMVL